jgi:hypothetical protein
MNLDHLILDGHSIRPPMKFGVAAYAIVRDNEAEAKRELERITNVKQFAAATRTISNGWRAILPKP